MEGAFTAQQVVCVSATDVCTATWALAWSEKRKGRTQQAYCDGRALALGG